MHRLAHAVGVENRGTHVLLHLPLAQHAWSAAALLRLQGLRCAVPAQMSPLDGARSSLHSEAASECIEASTPHPGAVVGEDGVLVLWGVELHAWWREWRGMKRGRSSGRFLHVKKSFFLRRAIACENERRRVEKESMYEDKKTSSTHAALGLPRCCFLTELRQRQELWMDFSRP